MRRNGTVLRSLRTIFDAGTVAGLTDGQLLERFAARQGTPAELAFAAIVERHGPMVLRVCRSHLQHHHDAEDAFQATFLVLVRRARSLWVRDSLGPWLHRVAQRAAIRAKRDAGRRRASEVVNSEGLESIAALPIKHDDLAPLIHQELDRLPERYRAPLVLCELEGRTHEEAARHLGCPVGTIKSRLSRGRDHLRDRLQRRGLAPAALGTLVLGRETVRAAVPASLKERTVSTVLAGFATRAASGVVPASILALSEGVLQTMFLFKLKTIAAALALGVAATGAVVLAQQSPDGAVGEARTLPPPVLTRPSADVTFTGASPLPTRGQSERSDSDRIAELERKLDMLMKAIESQKRELVEHPIPVAVSRSSLTLAKPITGFQAASADLPNIAATSASVPVVQGVPANNGPSLLDVMKRLEALERKLDRVLETTERGRR